MINCVHAVPGVFIGEQVGRTELESFVCSLFVKCGVALIQWEQRTMITFTHNIPQILTASTNMLRRAMRSCTFSPIFILSAKIRGGLHTFSGTLTTSRSLAFTIPTAAIRRLGSISSIRCRSGRLTSYRKLVAQLAEAAVVVMHCSRAPCCRPGGWNCGRGVFNHRHWVVQQVS